MTVTQKSTRVFIPHPSPTGKRELGRFEIRTNKKVTTFPVLEVADFISGHKFVVWPIVYDPGARRSAGFQNCHLLKAAGVYLVASLCTEGKDSEKVTDRCRGQLGDRQTMAMNECNKQGWNQKPEVTLFEICLVQADITLRRTPRAIGWSGDYE